MSDDIMLEEFFHEATMLFDEAEEALMEIDKGNDFEPNFNKCYRAFHSVKGAAGMFNLKVLQSHVHCLENLMDDIKADGKFSPGMVDYFLKGIDSSKEILEGQKESSFKHLNAEELRGIDGQQADNKVIPISSQVEEPKRDNLSQAKKSKIFVIDDEEDILNILVEMLEERYEVHTFVSPQESLEQIDELDPDLVLTDFQMPKMNGIQLTQAIHAQKTMLPILMISGHLSVEIIINALDKGASGFVRKPFEQDLIHSLCSQNIRKYKAFKTLDLSIKCLLYQFSDLDSFLQESGNESVRASLRDQIKIILEQRDSIKAS